MILDAIILALAVLFGLLGWFTGWWSQLVRLGALLTAYLLAGPGGKLFGSGLSAWWGLPPLLGRIGASAMTFVLVYVVLATLGAVVVRRWKKKAESAGNLLFRTSDRVAGAALGAAKVLALSYLLLCGLVLLEEPLKRITGNKFSPLEGSGLATFARHHNALSGLHLPLIGQLPKLARLSADPELPEKLARSPQVKKLLSHPKIQALAEDRVLQAAARRNDIAAILGNPRLNAALSDPEILRLLEQIDLDRL